MAGVLGGPLTPVPGYTYSSGNPDLFQVDQGGTTKYFAPQGFSPGGGTATMRPGSAEAAGGTPYTDPYAANVAAHPYQPANPAFGTAQPYNLPYSPSGFLFDKPPSGLNGMYSYSPGEKTSLMNSDFGVLALVGGAAVGGAVAGGLFGGAPAVSGGLGGYELPAATAASGLPFAGGSSVIAPAVGEQAVAGAAATAAGSGGLFPASLGGTAGSAAETGIPAAAQGLTGSTAASNIITGPGGTLAGLAPAAATSSGGLLGLTGGQEAVLGGGLAAGLLLGGRQIPQSGYLSNEQQQQGAQGQQLIQNAINGKLTPGQQAQLTEWKNSQMASAKQFLINSGQGTDSTAMLGLQQNIDKSAIAISQGFLDQSFQQGLSELGIADAATAQLVQGRLIQQQQTGQALSNFMLTFGLMSGWGG